MSDLRASLWAAYETTLFTVATPFGKFEIRPGQISPLLDQLLDHLGARNWAYVTAHNPRSQRLSGDENAARHEELKRRVLDGGYPAFEGEGVGQDKTWTPEKSLLIVGIDATEAVALGKEFGQFAIVIGDRGRPAQLRNC